MLLFLGWDNQPSSSRATPKPVKSNVVKNDDDDWDDDPQPSTSKH